MAFLSHDASRCGAIWSYSRLCAAPHTPRIARAESNPAAQERAADSPYRAGMIPEAGSRFSSTMR